MTSRSESSRLHPAFEATTPSHRWTRGLAELWETLRRDAWKAEGGWAWYRLPGGAKVALRVGEHFRRELRISRPEPALTDVQRGKWRHKVETFLKYFPPVPPAPGWWEAEPPEGAGVAVLFVELRTGEVRPGFGRCACGVEAPIESPYVAECEECRTLRLQAVRHA